MFGALNRQLAKLLAKQKEREEGAEMADRALRRLRDLGDTASDRSDPVQSLEAIVRNDDVRGLMAHLETHGLDGVRQLSERVEASADFQASRAAKAASEQAFWANSPPLISEGQEGILSTIQDEGIQSVVRAAMRTGIAYDIEFRPASQDDLSFIGGLPCVGSGLVWPRDPRTDAPLPFLGQIDVGDLPDFPLRSCFPDTGALVFFAPPRSGDYPLIVQHVSLEHAEPHPLPGGTKPYYSCFQNAFSGTAKGTIGWLHETEVDAAPFTIRPKWPIKPRLASFAPWHQDLYAFDGEIPDKVLDTFGGKLETFIETLARSLNAIPTARTDAERTLFDGFPHVWGAIEDMTGRFLPVIDSCKDIHGDQTPSDVHELYEIVSSWRDIAREFGPSARVSDQDRAGFHDVLRLMAADSGIALPAQETSWGPKVLNAAATLHGFVISLQTYWTLSSLCSDPTTLSPEMRKSMTASFAEDFPSRGHIQSLGHVKGKSGEESALSSVLLMQFPWSYMPDWTDLYGIDGMQFWMSYEDIKARNYSAVYCEF